MSQRLFSIMLVVTILVVAPLLQTASACPFCSTPQQTLTEEINSSPIAVIAKLVEIPPPEKPKAGGGRASRLLSDVPKARFQITHVLKGKAALGKSRTIHTIYFGNAKPGSSFYITGIDPPRIMWATPVPVSLKAQKYLAQLPMLPKKGPTRLKFFQNYFQDKDEILARDAYDEFAKAPYDDIKSLRKDLKHDQLTNWIKDPNISASRRRLYLTLLGVCGTKADLPLLESLLKSDDRRKKAGLDAMIACYLTLKGAQGLPLIEDLFLKNRKSQYADTYAAIMAIRFHGDQSDIIPRKRLLVSLRHMLERPQLADLVIRDLARWKDWSQMDRLVTLFKEADEKSSWVRVPVINYLRACPDPKAAKCIQQLEKVDPAAVKRARTFFPFKDDKPAATKAS